MKVLLFFFFSLCACGMLIWQAYPGEFIADDFTHILDAQILSWWPSFSDFFGPGWQNGPTWAYRPIVSLSYLLEKQILPFQPTYMRMTNAFIHCLNVFLVLLIAKRNKEQTPLMYLVVGALFLLHPVALHSVLYVASRSTLLVTFWILLAIYFSRREDSNPWVNLIIAGFSCILAAFTKETGLLALPLTIIFFRKNRIVFSRKAALIGLPALMLVAIAIARIRYEAIVAFFGDGNPRLYDWSTYAATEIRSLWIYAKLIVLPMTEWRFFHGVDLVSETLLYFCVGGVLLLGFVYLGVRAWKDDKFVPFFAAIFAMIPELFYPRELIVSEHRIYLPLALLTIGVLWRLEELPLRFVKKALVTAGLVLLFHFGLSFQRAQVYASSEGILKHDLERDPNNALAAEIYGEFLFTKNQLQEALPYFEIAYSKLQNNMEKSSWNRGELQKVFLRRGLIYARLDQKERLQKSFGECEELRFKSAFCNLYRAMIFNLRRDFEHAYARIPDLNLTDSYSTYQAFIAAAGVGDFASAVRYGKMLLTVSQDASFYVAFGMVLDRFDRSQVPAYLEEVRRRLAVKGQDLPAQLKALEHR